MSTNAGEVRGPHTSVCDECRRGPIPSAVAELRRATGPAVDPVACLLAQGLLCCGPGTRAGCGATCVSQQSPCIGCYGANGDGTDFAERIIDVLGTLVPGCADDPERCLAGAGLPGVRTLLRQFEVSHELLRRRVQATLVARDLRTDA